MGPLPSPPGTFLAFHTKQPTPVLRGQQSG